LDAGDMIFVEKGRGVIGCSELRMAACAACVVSSWMAALSAGHEAARATSMRSCCLAGGRQRRPLRRGAAMKWLVGVTSVGGATAGGSRWCHNCLWGPNKRRELRKWRNLAGTTAMPSCQRANTVSLIAQYFVRESQ
jgi:hypothetical protein